MAFIAAAKLVVKSVSNNKTSDKKVKKVAVRNGNLFNLKKSQIPKRGKAFQDERQKLSFPVLYRLLIQRGFFRPKCARNGHVGFSDTNPGTGRLIQECSGYYSLNYLEK